MVDEIWSEYDENNNGTLEYQESLEFTKDLMKQIGTKNNMDIERFEKIFKMMDKDGSGCIDKTEMAVFVSQLKAIQTEGNFKQNGI